MQAPKNISLLSNTNGLKNISSSKLLNVIKKIVPNTSLLKLSSQLSINVINVKVKQKKAMLASNELLPFPQNSALQLNAATSKAVLIVDSTSLNAFMASFLKLSSYRWSANRTNTY